MQRFAKDKSDGDQTPVVLHVVQSLQGGGAEALVCDLIPRLRQRGIDARVLCAYDSTQLPPSEVSGWVDSVYYQQRTGISKFQYLMTMRGLMRRISPHIVHTHTHVGSTWGRAAAVLAGVPLIIHTEHRSVETFTGLERAATTILNHRTQAIITFSERTAELVRRREAVREISVIPNGIPLRPAPTQEDRHAAREKLGFEENLVIVGVVANLYEHKNPALAIEAFACISSDTRRGSRLAFFGDGPLRSDLLRRVQELELEGLVRFYGFRNDLKSLLPGLDLVLTTSPREMMPISLLEAMNAALPIIGTPHAGTLDLVIDRETGLILRSWDQAAIAEAIEQAVLQPGWRHRAGEAAYERLKRNFDIEMVTDRYVDLYRKMLRRKLALN